MFIAPFPARNNAFPTEITVGLDLYDASLAEINFPAGFFSNLQSFSLQGLF
jgi:hypothetical protein